MICVPIRSQTLSLSFFAFKKRVIDLTGALSVSRGFAKFCRIWVGFGLVKFEFGLMIRRCGCWRGCAVHVGRVHVWGLFDGVEKEGRKEGSFEGTAE